MASMSIKVDKPQAGATIWGPASGVWIDVSGTATVTGGVPNTQRTTSIGVQLGSGGAMEAAQLHGNQWSYRGLVTTPGSLMIMVEAEGRFEGPNGESDDVSASTSVAVSVSFDTSPPQLTISSPTSMPPIEVSEAGSNVPLRVTAQDNRGVQGVEWRLDSSLAYTPATLESNELWKAVVAVPPMPLGNHTITVRGTDIFGNTAEQAVTFVTIDTTPPAYEIIEPEENAKILGTGTGATVKLTGTAKDLQTGVKSVEWSLDRVQFSQANTTDNWATWSGDVPITDYGFYPVSVRLTDHAGNSTTVVRNFDVVSSYEPQDTEQLLSTRAYLDALLGFASNHVRTSSGAPLLTDNLTHEFHQPFGKLKEPLSELGNLPVNRLRICAEVLREYLKSQPKVLLAHWKCDEGSGTTLGDASTYGNDGTLVPLSSTPMWAPGKFGSALNFDGAGSEARIPHSTSLELGKDDTDFSVAFWMYLRPEGFIGQWRAIMNKGMPNSGRTPGLWVHPDNNRVHYRISTTSDWNEGGDSAKEIEWRTWTHIAYVKSGSRLKLYIDGGLDSEVGLVGESVSNNEPLSLGMGGGFGGIDGSLDDIRIYNLAVSETSVRALADGNAAETSVLPQATESGYRLTAYETLLMKIGTSYQEIRLARGAAPKVRTALADRLGIRLDFARPDQLDRLLPPPNLDESWMEQMFGLADTNRGLLQPPAPRPELLGWQEQHLKELWMSQDHPAQPGTQPQPPIIDPDQIGKDDLADPVAGNPAFDLWQDRDKWVSSEYDTLKQKREAQATLIAGFDAIVDYALGAGTDLPALEAEYEAGKSIDTKLRALHLTMQTFTCLLRPRALAQAGTVTDDEWADVYGILTQVRKSQQHETWRTLEQQKQIALTPEYFKVSEGTNQLPSWRASMQARREWQDTLRARIDQMRDLGDGLRASVGAAEEIALPVLRDALVATIAGPGIADQVADRLTEWLLIDVKDGGSQTTTRILQAIETIQGLIFSRRTLRFDKSHPASRWDVVGGEEGSTPAEREKNFDEEWKWMGSYAAWRAATLVFLYPENMLLPGLREQNNQSPEFKTLVEDLRKNSLLTATTARDEHAKKYLEDLSARLGSQTTFQWLGTITLTEQLSEQELLDRGGEIKKWWSTPDNVPVLKEVFYFVPMLLALQLQQSGEYVAALDWYQTVYAYNLSLKKPPETPPETLSERRKIYYGLELEVNAAPVLEKGKHWLRTLLNPHSIAQTRPNSYTRYTLMCLVRCFLEFGDSEFTRDTGESISRARSLYTTARELLTLPELELRTPADPSQVLLPNPVLAALRLRAEMQLAKLRQGRNIAGMKRTLEIPTPPRTVSIQISRDGRISAPSATVLRPTPYYYRVLIERGKQLANIAQQIEAAYLNTLEQLSAEQYRRFEADNALDLADAGVELLALRVTEAQKGETLAQKQQERSDFLSGEYDRMINAGLNEHEHKMIDAYWESMRYQNVIAGLDAAIGAAQFIGSAANLPDAVFSAGAKQGIAAGGVIAHGFRALETGFLNSAQASIQANSLYASQERRVDEWRLQKGVADQDSLIAAQQLLMAQDHTAVTRQEEKIADTQAAQAKATVDFLDNQFLNAEMYEWMSGILGSVYRYFLQQATAMAKLAENQLAFERQQIPPSFIQADYWVAPSVDSTSATQDAKEKDRGGLTGSARLLQDIYQLDQHAFESEKRKLNLAQTFSLARLAPFEFQQFRETGVLRFATPMQLFDQGFPGHYLRLIKRARTSVVALIPPTQGIRATLTASGISRVVIGGDVFQETIVRRDPELVALTSPTSATGVFELDTQSEMLLPFEAMGVDTAWEFQMPKAANPFDYSTIADVLITLEYTALNDFNYRQQVVQELNQRSSFSGQRSFSIRQQFADAWYDLHNPEQVEAQDQMVARFETGTEDFPANIETPTIKHILVYIAPSGGRPFADLLRKLAVDPVDQLKTSLYFTPPPLPDAAQNGSTVQPVAVGGEASSQDGRFSTLAGNAVSWKNHIASGEIKPYGEWTLALPNTEAMKKCFEDEEIEDILFVITYSGRTQEWPA